MKIVDAEWTPQINILLIKCKCGKILRHRADKWKVLCPCGKWGHLSNLRKRYESG